MRVIALFHALLKLHENLFFRLSSRHIKSAILNFKFLISNLNSANRRTHYNKFSEI